MTDVVTRIDKLLGSYYKSMGINDYFDVNGDGKFMIWCNDEGYDDDSLKDDLGTGCTVEDCASCEFDENFPLNESIVNKTQQTNAIFQIIQRYYFEATSSNEEQKQPYIALNRAHKIDQALALYYHNMNRNDYYDKYQKKGLFLTAFNDGDFDINDINNQLNDKANIDECCFLDFDFLNVRKFPFHPSINNDIDDKRITIFNILKYCYKHSMPPKHATIIDEPTKKMIEPTGHLQYDFIRDKNKLNEITKEVSELYKVECPTITNGMNMTDSDLELLLSIGYANGGIPILQYFVDSFMRDRINKVVNININDITVHEWVNNNKYISHLNKQYNDINIGLSIEHAIKSYIKRISPKLFLNPMVKIKDDLYQIAKYVMAASQFIDYIVRKGQRLNHSKAPFQFDFVILVKECSPLTSQDTIVIPFENENEIEIKNDNYYNKYTDCIGIVPKRLHNNKLIFFKDDINPRGNNTDKARTPLRCMTEPYEKFIVKLISERGENNMKYFPYLERFCAIIDRRNFITDTEFNEKDISMDKHIIINRNPNQKKKDEIIYFELPNDCRYLNQNHVAETQFDLLQKCILPRIGYESKQMENVMKNNASLMNMKCRSNLTSRQSCNGGYLLFSFFVKSWDEVRCYMWWMGQCVRFLPQDIIDVLPRLFDIKYGMNKHFDISHNAVKDIVSKTAFRDNYFRNWYKKTTHINNQQDLDKYSHVYKASK
eukprot:319771_1